METTLQRKPIMSRLRIMEIGDVIQFPFIQRTSVENTRTRLQGLEKGKKFTLESIDPYTFKVVRTA